MDAETLKTCAADLLGAALLCRRPGGGAALPSKPLPHLAAGAAPPCC